jgi:CHAT domain-containing protein
MSVLAPLAVVFGPPARAEVFDPSPSDRTLAALAANDRQTYQILLLREAAACAAANMAPGSCADLLLRVREGVQSYNGFGYDLGPPLSWDPSRPSIINSPANAAKAKELAALAPKRVLGRYEPHDAALLYGEHKAPFADDEEALRALLRAVPNLLNANGDPDLPRLINAISARVYRLGGESAATSIFIGSIVHQTGIEEAVARPDADPELAAILLNNGYVLAETANGSGEFKQLQRAQALMNRVRTGNTIAGVVIDLNFARATDRSGSHAEAEQAYSIAIAKLRTLVDPSDYRIGLALAGRAAAVAGVGRVAEARLLLSQARGILAADEGLRSIGLLEAELSVIQAMPSSADATGQALRAALAQSGGQEPRAGILDKLTADPAIPEDRRQRLSQDIPGEPGRPSYQARFRTIAQLHAQLAHFLADRRQLADASGEIEAALKTDPYNVDAILLRSFIAMNSTDDLVMTRNDLQILIGRLPADSAQAITARQYLGVIQLKAMNLYGALDSFHKAGASARQRIAQVRDFDITSLQEVLATKETFSMQMMVDALGAKVASASTPKQYTSASLIDDAFQAAQSGMQTETAGALTRTAARFARGRSPVAALEAQRESLSRQRDAAERIYSSLLSATSPDRVRRRDAAGADRDALAAELTKVSLQIATLDPAYAELSKPDALSVKTTQELLNRDEAVLLLYPSEDATYAFAISQDAVAWTRSEVMKRTALNNKVDQLREALDGNADHPFDRRLAFELYQELVKPVESALAGKGVVMTIGGEALGKLPLALLVAAPPTGDDSNPQALQSTAWLGDRYALTTLPALSSLKALRCWLADDGSVRPVCGRPGRASLRRSAAGAPLLVGFGAPALRGAPAEGSQRSASFSSAFTGKLADGAYLRDLAYLPYAKQELERVQSLFPAGRSAVLTGRSATESAAKSSTLLSQTRYAIFSTHGLLAGEAGVPGEPGLVFTPPPDGQASALDDGLLTASEAAELHLQADLVVLSACNTAASDGSSGGEGLSGLARGFLFAGARSLLVSHWPVNDLATSALMADLFMRLQRGEPRASALQQAMLGVRAKAEWASPRYWAPFVLVGTGN